MSTPAAIEQLLDAVLVETNTQYVVKGKYAMNSSRYTYQLAIQIFKNNKEFWQNSQNLIFC
jgi:hypothetical protein